MSYDANKGISVVLVTELENTAPTDLSRSVKITDRRILDAILKRNEPEAVLEAIAGIFFEQLEDNVELLEEIKEAGVEIPSEARAPYDTVAGYAEQTATVIYAAAHFIKALNDKRRGTSDPNVQTVVQDIRSGRGGTAGTTSGTTPVLKTAREAYGELGDILDKLGVR